MMLFNKLGGLSLVLLTLGSAAAPLGATGKSLVDHHGHARRNVVAAG